MMKKSKTVQLRIDPITLDLLSILARRADENRSSTLRALIHNAADELGISTPRLNYYRKDN
jgi:hypothetical protein